MFSDTLRAASGELVGDIDCCLRRSVHRLRLRPGCAPLLFGESLFTSVDDSGADVVAEVDRTVADDSGAVGDGADVGGAF